MTPLTTGAARSLCVLGALTLSGLAAAPAAASHGYRPFPSNVYVSYEGSAGTLRIGACSYRISAYADVCTQLVDAFRRSGHRAWIDGGCVRVEWCGRRPGVSWSSAGWTMTIRSDGRCGVFTPHKPPARPVCTTPVRRAWWGHRDWRHDGRRDRWRRPRCR